MIQGILNVIIQIGQIGPLAFVILRRIFPMHVTYRPAIFLVLLIGLSACILLAFFWRETAFIGSERRSIALYVLVFAFSILGNSNNRVWVKFLFEFENRVFLLISIHLDQTANVTFLQWIGEAFVTEYIMANYSKKFTLKLLRKLDRLS